MGFPMTSMCLLAFDSVTKNSCHRPLILLHVAMNHNYVCPSTFSKGSNEQKSKQGLFYVKGQIVVRKGGWPNSYL